MKKLLGATFVVASLIMTTFIAQPAFAKEKELVLNVSGQPVLHGLPTWQMLKEKSLPENYKVSLHMFPSGAPQVEALAAGNWDLGTMGALPTMLSGLRLKTLLIGMYCNDSEVNDIWVRPDSPLLKTKGYNPKYPEIYGTPDDWRGKKILCTTISNGHYALSVTLKALGLSDKDVNIVQIEQGQAMAAFSAGEGDIVQLWAPGSYVAEDKGWKRVSSGGAAGSVIPGGIVVSKDFAAKHPDMVVEWLDQYMRVVEGQWQDKEKATTTIIDYFVNYAGVPMTKDLVERDFSRRPIFTVEEQVKLLADPTKVQTWMGDIASFMADGKRITAKELASYKKNNCYVEPKFMQLVLEKRQREAAAKTQK